MAHLKKEVPSRVYGAIFKVLFMRQQFTTGIRERMRANF
jgi:hypothetical protein